MRWWTGFKVILGGWGLGQQLIYPVCNQWGGCQFWGGCVWIRATVALEKSAVNQTRLKWT